MARVSLSSVLAQSRVTLRLITVFITCRSCYCARGYIVPLKTRVCTLRHDDLIYRVSYCRYALDTHNVHLSHVLQNVLAPRVIDS